MKEKVLILTHQLLSSAHSIKSVSKRGKKVIMMTREEEDLARKLLSIQQRLINDLLYSFTILIDEAFKNIIMKGKIKC
jgi:hypothetical protein